MASPLPGFRDKRVTVSRGRQPLAQLPTWRARVSVSVRHRWPCQQLAAAGMVCKDHTKPTNRRTPCGQNASTIFSMLMYVRIVIDVLEGCKEEGSGPRVSSTFSNNGIGVAPTHTCLYSNHITRGVKSWMLSCAPYQEFSTQSNEMCIL